MAKKIYTNVRDRETWRAWRKLRTSLPNIIGILNIENEMDKTCSKHGKEQR
jgi:Fe-S cluster biosynthesis and repair protein YggX